MQKNLNAENVRSAMERKGLSQADLAAKLKVSREAVSKWLSGSKNPRPDKLLRLAGILGLDFDELVVKASDPMEPVVAFRKKGSTKTTELHVARAKGMGRQLACLVPYLPFDEFVQPSKLRSPSLDYDYIQSFAAKVREELGLRLDQVLDFSDLIRTFQELHAVIVPVMWGKKGGHENALHIYLPDSMSTWIYLNLDTEKHDFNFWMAHELGHVYSPDLRGKPSEDFADAFAAALLFPGKLAEQAYNDVAGASRDGDKVLIIKEYALKYSISLLTVYYEINKFAESAGKVKIDLDKGIYGANTNFHKQFRTISETLFGGVDPSAKEFIQVTTKEFQTPFFDSLKLYLAEQGKSPGLIQLLLDSPLYDAKELYAELS